MQRSLIKLILWIGICPILQAQTYLPLNDLSAFRPVMTNWKIAGGLTGDNTSGGPIKTSPGQGVLVCEHSDGKYGIDYDLFTQEDHGDLDLELDFVLAKGSNSGIYLQSRYEIQLYDSWAKSHPKYSDCGGIYERWNDSKPEGEKGYEGIPPRINVAKAPGLWQHLKISFQAPRFDAMGKKTESAKIIAIEWNGIIIHENVILTGPTRGPIKDDEVAMAPLRFQGDHGHVAFKNIQFKKFTTERLTFSELHHGVYKGPFKTIEDIARLQPASQGNAAVLNWAVTNEENDFGIKYSGKLRVPRPGKYTFTTVHGGQAQLKINNQPVFDQGWLWNGAPGRKVTVELPAGDLPFELYYWKTDAWLVPLLGLFVESATIRKHGLHLPSSAITNNPTPLIYAQPREGEPMILRSFMDIPHGNTSKRIVHAISVGHPAGIHYTYDLDRGSIVQIWRGGFLNTAPMWHDRGDGSAVPMGSITYLLDTNTVFPKNNRMITSLRPRGYELDATGIPTFKYELNGFTVSDKIIPKDEGRWFERTWANPSGESMEAILAISDQIIPVNENTFVIGDGSYYIRVLDGKAEIKSESDTYILTFPILKSSTIQIIW